MDVGTIGFFGALAFLGVFGGALLRQRLLAGSPKAIEDGFSFRAGGVFDKVNLSFPFVRVSCSRNSLTIEYAGARLRIEYCDMARIEIVSGLFSEGIDIGTSSGSVPGRVTIWTPYSRKLKTYLSDRM